MILPDPAYQQCRAESLAGAMRRAVVLLYRRPRTLGEDAELMQAAWAAWETAAIHGEAAHRVSAGLLLAQAHLALGQGQEAIATAGRVQQVARGSSVATAATVRALAVGAQGWRSLQRPEHAEHLLGDRPDHHRNHAGSDRTPATGHAADERMRAKELNSMHLTCILCTLIMSLSAVAAAADAQPPAVLAALDHLRAANTARTAIAHESAAWATERQRLEALIVATEAESTRLIRDAETAERDRDAATARLSALGSGSDLDAVRLRLGEAGQNLAQALSDLARRLPPGAVPTPAVRGGEAGFDAAVRSLDAAERASGSVAVEVVTGQRDGATAAVKILRVAGASAWWVSLDGAAAGTVAMADGTVRLTASDEAGRLAITAALQQAEGRGQPGVVLLPGVTP